ncbi:MAG: pilus assembly protein PilM [Anaerolineaceae bacterium]|nr:pilus assembly protein PilM [Anaerolineaceae bacterium]
MTVKQGHHVNPIGIDLSGEGLRAVQLESLERGMKLTQAASSPWPIRSEEDLRAQVGRLLKEHSFQGYRITTALPSDQVSVHHVRLPMMPQSRLTGAITSTVAERLPYPVDESVIRHLKIHSTEGQDSQADHIAFAVPRRLVEQHLHMAERLGLMVVGISALPLAVGHAFSYLGRRLDETDFTFLLVHLEKQATHLVIMHEGEMRFARTIYQGVHDILEAVAKQTGEGIETLVEQQQLLMRHQDGNVMLNSRMAEAPAAPGNASPVSYDSAGAVMDRYVDEILSGLCYFSSTISTQGIDKAVFVGPLANDYGFCQILANRLGLPAQIGDPFAGIQVGEGEDQASVAQRRPEPEMVAAVGLSLFGTMVN